MHGPVNGKNVTASAVKSNPRSVHNHSAEILFLYHKKNFNIDFLDVLNVLISY